VNSQAPFFTLCPKTHFFSPVIYNFNVFFFALNKRKKWESGQKTRKTLRPNGFRLPTFEIKPGKNPLFLGKTVRTNLSRRPQFSQSGYKNRAYTHFPTKKWAEKLAQISNLD
jgi:hypothetical protein